MEKAEKEIAAKTLQELLKDIAVVGDDIHINITGISSDSRIVQPGDLFIASLGEQYDGRKYIAEAIEHGAAAVVFEEENQETVARHLQFHLLPQHIPMFPVKNLQKSVGLIAARFYNDPSADMLVIGITGTNGKTSTSQFIARTLEKAGIACGVIGTLGSGFPDDLKPNPLTTPDPITLQKTLAELKQQGAKAVAMEVSSHSLVQQRVAGTHFTLAVFTNLTRDHLDYHGDMIHYANAKKMLFQQPGLRYAVINLDDEYGRLYLKQIPETVKVYGYTLHNKHIADVPTVHADNIKLAATGFSSSIQSPWGDGNLSTRLLGRFNLSNLLATLTATNILQVPFNKSLNYLSELNTVSGRMQIFGGNNQPIIVVDYAHTPDALEQALLALREHCEGKLWCMFGCGGERDRGKRPMMAQVAEKFSDKIIVTDDNPRREYSQKIIEDIMQGFLYPHAVTVINDRAAAIAHAVQTAKPGDVVLIAGKGHEPYQIIGTEKISFSDAEHVQTELNQLKKTN